MATYTYKIGNPTAIVQKSTSGYKDSFSAITDLGDNSFDASSTVVEVSVELDEKDRPISLQIADIGKGISEKHQCKFVQPNWTSKETGKDTTTNETSVGLFGFALPSALLFLGSKATISTSQRGSMPQYCEYDAADVVAPGSKEQKDSFFKCFTGQDVSKENVEKHFSTIRNVYSLKKVKTDDVQDTNLSGTVVTISDLHSVRNDLFSSDFMDKLKAHLSMVYSAKMDPVLSPIAREDKAGVKIFITTYKAGVKISTDECKPYYITPMISKDFYDKSKRNLRYFRSDSARYSDVITVTSGQFSAKMDIDISVVDDPQAGGDVALQYLQQRFRSGIAVYLGGRLINVNEAQMSALIGRHPKFAAGNTGMSRMGRNLMITVSADFDDSTPGEIRNRPHTADLLGVQSCKNDFILRDDLLDAIASCKGFKQMLNYIYQANLTGVNLPNSMQDFVNDFLHINDKGQNALDRISQVIFGKTGELKLKPVHRPGSALLEWDSKTQTIEWNFDSDSHHIGMSKDLEGGKEDMVVVKICLWLFTELNQYVKNIFLDPTEMARAAGVDLATKRKRLFTGDYEKVDKKTTAA